MEDKDGCQSDKTQWENPGFWSNAIPSMTEIFAFQGKTETAMTTTAPGELLGTQ